MPYQFKREPLTQDEATRLAKRQAVNLTPSQLRALNPNEFTFAMDLLMRGGDGGREHP